MFPGPTARHHGSLSGMRGLRHPLRSAFDRIGVPGVHVEAGEGCVDSSCSQAPSTHCSSVPTRRLSQHADACRRQCWETYLKALPAELNKVIDEKGLTSGRSSLSCQGRDTQFLDVAPGCRPHLGSCCLDHKQDSWGLGRHPASLALDPELFHSACP